MAVALVSRQLSAYIRYQLYKQGISHRDFARSIGISNTYFSNLLRGAETYTGAKAEERVRNILKVLEIKEGDWID